MRSYLSLVTVFALAFSVSVANADEAGSNPADWTTLEDMELNSIVLGPLDSLDPVSMAENPEGITPDKVKEKVIGGFEKLHDRKINGNGAMPELGLSSVAPNNLGIPNSTGGALPALPAAVIQILPIPTHLPNP